MVYRYSSPRGGFEHEQQGKNCGAAHNADMFAKWGQVVAISSSSGGAVEGNERGCGRWSRDQQG